MRDKGVKRAGEDGKWKYLMVIFVLQLAWGGFLIIVLFQYSKLKLLHRKVQFRAQTKLSIFLFSVLFLLNVFIKAYSKGGVGNASYTRKSILCHTEEIVQTKCILS